MQYSKDNKESKSHLSLKGKIRLVATWNNPKKQLELSCTSFTGSSVDQTIYFDDPNEKTRSINYLGQTSEGQELEINLEKIPQEIEILTFAITNFYDAYFEEKTEISYKFVNSENNSLLSESKVHCEPNNSSVFICFLYRLPSNPNDWKLKNVNVIYNKRSRVMQDIIPEIGKHLSSKEQHLLGGSSKPFHTVFVLDASGSMNGQPWKDLENAVKQFISSRRETSPNDIYSIVIYDTSASIACEKISIKNNPDKYLKFSGGGTSFSAGLGTSNEVISRNHHSKYIPLLLFLSDGESSDGKSEMETIANKYIKTKGVGLQVYTVGFGSGSSHSSLKQFAEIGQGKFLLASDGIALGRTFAMISDEMSQKK